VLKVDENQVVGPSPDWRPLVVQRTSRIITAVAAPAAVIVAISPSPFSLLDRISVLSIALVTGLVALLARRGGPVQRLAALLVGGLLFISLGLAARLGMVPGVAIVLCGTLVLTAIFFGSRAVWWVTAMTALALVGLGAANRAGWLHPTDPARAFNWSDMSVWVRVAAGFVGSASVAASAVATVISHLEESLRERERLILAERSAVRENERLLDAEKRSRERLLRLQQVTASLARAATPEEVIDAVCRISCEGKEGHSALLWTMRKDGALVLAGAWGSQSEYLDNFRIIPPRGNLPAHRVLDRGEPLWVETEADFVAAVSPEIVAKARPAGRILSYCMFALSVGGVTRGIVCFSLPIGHHFDEDERHYYTSLSLYCAYALERATLHQAAREAATRAEAASRVKDEFLSTVSHELRTPLNAITGWVRMLRSGGLPAERSEHALEVIDRNAAGQAKLISDLLDVSRIEAGSLRLNLAPVEPASFVQMALDSVKPDADSKGVRLFTVLGKVGPLVGDAERLQQVVSNLLTNAVKFSQPGSAIEIALASDADDVVITVRDQGEGISADFLPSIFQPFRQAHGGFKRVHGGLGLGLTIAKQLVELHGGTIEARSDGPGKGATFVVRIPSSPCPAVDGPAGEGARGPDLSAGGALRGTRILLVEDEPDTRELLLALFDACGADACGTSSAADALAEFLRTPPDVIVSDVGLRGEDGLSLLRKLRSLPGGDVPAVAVTAFARVSDREVALAAGFDAHVAKPIEPEQLLHLVSDLVKGRRPASHPEFERRA
jgi:signal transduction histidine kinase/ActR/RegA family two-component response regulator